jgi:DNA-binding XRE family transcriptional regulator
MKKLSLKLTDEQKAKLRSIDFNKQPGFVSAESLLTEEVGEAGSPERVELDAKAKAWYYGEVLREKRKSLGITQQELADRVGRDRTYIIRIEKGETDLQLSSFIRLADALGLTISLA